jgi:hypothetical protein
MSAALAAGCSASAPAAADGASDAVDDVGAPACPAPEAGTPAGVADDFGPNAKLVGTPSALGQLDVYEIVAPRRLEWVDLYLRADLAGTRVTISVYQALARGAVFSKLTDVQLDVPTCVGWIGSGPLGVPLEAGRFYAVGFDPNQAVSTFVDSESSDLPIDGELGRLIGSKTATSVSLDTLDWGTLATSSFTRQRLFTSPGAGDGGATSQGAADAGAAD